MSEPHDGGNGRTRGAAPTGGERVADVLKAQGVRFLFTLCGGHISPILVACESRGIRVVDTRHEVTAVFAADAVARLTGVPGVAAVTAGPGVTNTITAVKNAQMAQSPLVLIGGAAPTALQGRGALQDIDQLSLLKPIVKWSTSVRRVKDLGPALENAFAKAQSGVPGPVFVECPVDLLYGEELVREWYASAMKGRSLAARARTGYLRLHLKRMFAGADAPFACEPRNPPPPAPSTRRVEQVAERLRAAERPVLLVGSQALLRTESVGEVAAAVERLGVPVYLSGMGRGLLGRDHPLQMRHKRRNALREADVIILAGVPLDFRLEYGDQIPRRTTYVSANRGREDLTKNRRPDVGVLGDPGLFLEELARRVPAGERWSGWMESLRARDAEREAAISSSADEPAEYLNPLRLCQEIDQALPDDSLLVGDGGDFVATASYTIQPRGPLSWLDPGPFGTLGVGAGFALAAQLCRPSSEVWILYGDGAAGYSLSEIDTFVRHGLPIISIVGNDAGWTQIAREQVEILGDDIGTVLAHTDYDCVAEGFGARGFRVEAPGRTAEVIAQARDAAAGGSPVLVNALIGKTDFRKGSISM